MATKTRNNVFQARMFQGQIPEMPEGYYSGDRPNPKLRAFVEAHRRERPYDPESDDYDVPAFDQPIATTKATAIYNMHTYWSKKPHDAIRQYIRHYTQPGDLVLDPFCGSGSTALAALMEGRKAIAIDRSPAATFITRNYCTPVDPAALQAAFAELEARVKPEIDWLYETRCDRCGGRAATAYTVYSQVFQCPRCLAKVPLFDCIDTTGRTTAGKKRKATVCPHCHAKGYEEEISTSSERFGAVPVLVSYLCQNGCRPARGERRHDDPDPQKRDCFTNCDLAKIEQIEKREIPYWYPTDRMMHAPIDQECWGAKWRAGTSNFRTVDELFTKRNLWALAALRDGISALGSSGPANGLLFALSAILLNCSVMYRYRPSLKGGFQAGTYYTPPESQIINVWRAFADKVQDVMAGAREQAHSVQVLISTQSATSLADIASSSVDFVLTDPPYAGKVQYGELNFVWEAWLGLDTRWHDEEIIVNEVHGKTEADWTAMMRQAMAECYRVLKPGRWLSLCYHDTSEGTWALVQDIMAEVGFVVDRSQSALFIDTQQKSYNQLTADKVNKRDLVINFRKPRPHETGAAGNGELANGTFQEHVRAIVREYLEANPGSTKDRIYDEVVSRLVRAGRMEPHNFDELLAQVAEAEAEPGTGSQRWYLKEGEEIVIDRAESAKEDAAARALAGFIARKLAEDPAAEGVHYSDLFEQYVYTVQDKPRRALADWLLDYFFKTEAGTYRLPASEEEEQLKAQTRAAGTNRRIKRYLAYLEQGLPIPERLRPNDATLAGWIRDCKRSGLYEQGKLLYERGGLNPEHLPEEAQFAVEEDYQVCARMLARGKGEGEKRGKKAKRGKG